jgi:uncharacterized protein YecE (DUF72 family)
MARWLVGTSGHVYRDWRTRFYPSQARLGRRAACGFALPRALPARAWLPYYAASFDTVELNRPFYRLPRAATFRAWAAAVPPEFVFAVNNDGRAAAVRNARRLTELLEARAGRRRAA